MSQYYEPIVPNVPNVLNTLYVEYSVDPGSYVSMHWHNAIEIICVLEGSLTLETEKQFTDLKAGDFIVIAPNELHAALNPDGNTSIQLLTRNLQAKDMLTLGIACPETGPSPGSTSEVSITVDTLRTWSEDEWTIGSSDSDGGVSIETAYSVAQARDHAGEKGVWVCGYIVGGDLSSNKNGIRFEPPFESRTCIAIASRSSVSEKASCLSVQLTKGTFRDMLNLVDHADLLGRKVFLKGDIEASYYGIPGLKNLSDCSLK